MIEKILQENMQKEQTGISILMSDKIDFEQKLIRRVKDAIYSSKKKSTKRILQFLISMH